VPRTATSVADTVGALMPEPVIVIDESNICGLAQAGAGAAAHDWLTATGGAISYAIAAVGAAITAPDPPVLLPATRQLADGHHVGVVDTSAGKPRRHHRHRTTTVPTTLCAWSANGSSPSWAPSHVLIRLRASGSNQPIVWPRPPPSDPSHGRGGSQPPHPQITRQVSTAPAVRPGTGGAKPPGVVCCQVVDKPTNGDGRNSAARTRRAALPPW
jgi:hypothetical protein